MDPLAEDVKNLIGYELNLMHGTLMNDFTEQLYDYSKSYTSGEIQSQVISGGREKSWETWRVLCDQGKSRRKLEVHEDYKRLMNPPQYPLETLLKGIAQWERDLLTYTAANDDKGLEPETKKLCLENMCPEALQEHLLDKHEQGLIKTYDQYKQAVSTYVYRKTKRGKSNGTKKQNIHGLFGADEGSEEEPHDENCDGWENQVNELTQQAEKIAGQLNALVKGSGKFAKRPKGFGKGAKAGKGAGNGAAPMEVDHSDKDCYHCGEHGHIARNCPKGKAKVTRVAKTARLEKMAKAARPERGRGSRHYRRGSTCTPVRHRHSGRSGGNNTAPRLPHRRRTRDEPICSSKGTGSPRSRLSRSHGTTGSGRSQAAPRATGNSRAVHRAVSKR